jgi:hypothetical protein
VHASSTYQDEREAQILTGFGARNRLPCADVMLWTW